MKITQKTPRKAIQWTILGLIVLFAILAKVFDSITVDFEAYCPFGGIQSLGSYLLNNALSCTMTGVQIVMGITLVITIILFSKLFCSFICPIGTISEWLGSLGHKYNSQYCIKGIADKLLRSLKYGLLFTTLFHTLQSNELFCKKFDPFFGVSSGFNNDVVLAYSISAIFIVIVGSIFVRLFWCKYLCPLGALSNIFKFTSFIITLLVAYIVLLKIGIDINYVWPLATACIGGYLIEITGFYDKIFPIFKATRNEKSCVDCNLCTKSCHQGIDVATLKVVKSVDCDLCGDCVSVCPSANTMQFNKKKTLRYLPHIATVILVLMGMLAGQLWEIPTIDQRWYDFDNYENVQTYTRSGLSTVKCYGSSASFANKMRNIDGVLGVATYVDTKTAKIYYDATRITEENIDRAIFTPQKIVLRRLKAAETGVTKIHLTLENFFDKNDFTYLARFLQENTEATGLITKFGCPVIVEIFFPASVKMDSEKITNYVEMESFTYTSNDTEHTVNMNYKVMSTPVMTPLTKAEYVSTMFVPTNYQFNNRHTYTSDVCRKYIVASPLNNKNRASVKYLISHLSNDNGIVEFRSELNNKDEEVINIIYIDSLTTPEHIEAKLHSDTLEFNYKDGRIGKIENTFDFN